MKIPRLGQEDKLLKRLCYLMTVSALFLLACSPTQAAQEAVTNMTSPTVDEAETDTTYEPENAVEMGEVSGADEYYRLCAVCHREFAQSVTVREGTGMVR